MKRKVDIQELMAVTENMLLEKGYEAFHFKALAEELNIGRSTLYEYFSSKEELVTEYMTNIMDKIFLECKGTLTLPDPLGQLREMLNIFLKYSKLHQILQILPLIDRNSSPRVEKSLRKLDDQHNQMFQWIMDSIHAAQDKGQIRADLHPSVVAGLFFNAIQIPNRLHLEQDAWNRMMFDAIYHGLAR